MVTVSSADGSPDVELDSRRGRLLLTTVVLGTTVASLTATVVNVALPTLASDLDASSSGQKWIVNAYTLTLASFILVGGSLGDRFGRVRLYRIGVVWFAVASLLCAIAPTVELLIVCRLLQGIGGALLTPGSLAIIESSLRSDDRGRGVGAWSGITGIAGAIGPLVGGLLVEISWRWVFVINIPVAIAVIVLSRWLPETRDRSARDASIDVTGAVATAVLLAGLSYALIEGPEGGLSGVEIAAVVAAGMAAAVLWVVERRIAHPMVPIELFANRVFGVANGLTFAIYGGMGVLFFLLPIQLQVTAGWSALEAGAALIPVTLLMLVLSPRMGDLSGRIGPRLPLTFGPIATALGIVLMIRVGPDASFATDVLPAVIVFGLGLSGIVAPVTSTALGSVPDERAGAASGVNNAVARTGGLLAVAAIPGLAGLTGDALSDPTRLGDGFDTAMWISAAIVAAAGVAAFALLRPDDVAAEVAGEDVDDGRPCCHACPVDGQLSSVSRSSDH
ncbi:EmrB/QacA subfamily drug resistance transporter [Ilumatobacter fluminis]|uniref:EmrB/QacA subfamily drug resistance transporter n=1 Tax=Ilumatobacter fluminis TaxID=467091 RepID=A0A4R7I4G6_9ACTN|nr:MFS transporter [Ilumatobacter fluminis]TDT18180.1 EmrB/QacA subfamily drug resistance transporter [Ilumatobacter fluminis]